jgi:hypothetical protein
MNRLHNSLTHLHTSLNRLITTAQRRLDPSWLTRLERAAEFRTHWVSPDVIRFVSQKQFPADRLKIGKVLDGEWDDLNLFFEQLDFYQAFVAVTRNGQNWSDTSFFQRVLSEIRSGHTIWGCRTEDEFRTRLQALERLYDKVSDLGRFPDNNGTPVISVNIGRHGDLLLNDGQDWLAVAKILELRRIPIVIVARHRQWVEFKRKVVEYALRRKKRVYAPLLHPDLAWVPASRGHERFELIRHSLVSQGGTLLDIGCHWGYFCHRFEEIGFECIGVESNPNHLYFLEKLKRAGNNGFQIVGFSIFDYLRDEYRQYDVVLALSVFHHFIKLEKTLHQLKDLLTNLDTPEIYFQPHKRAESEMRNAYWDPSEDEFVAFILEHSILSRAVHLGRVDAGRSLYQLTV